MVFHSHYPRAQDNEIVNPIIAIFINDLFLPSLSGGAFWHVDLASNSPWFGSYRFGVSEPVEIANDGIFRVPTVPRNGYPSGDGLGFTAGTGKERGDRRFSFAAGAVRAESID